MEYGVQPDMVRPQLYIASVRTELYREVLDHNGITHILQVGAELAPSHPQHFTYLQLPVYDMPEQDIVGCFPAAFAFIESAIEAGGGVLVHCQAGISRSATVVIAYCMWKEHLGADAATALVTAARSVVWPNAGFRRQLQEFERLQWDASKWEGWGMAQFLSKQYGDDSVNFMAAMLGGAPQDRVSQRRELLQQQIELNEQQDGVCAAASRGCGLSCAATAAAPAVDAPHCRSGCSAGQYLLPVADAPPSGKQCRHHAKSPRKTHTSSAAHGSTGGSSGCMCKQAGGSTGSSRRLSLACYCSSGRSFGAAVGGSGSSGGVFGAAVGGNGSSGGHRLRRHSTGQYALAAAAAGFTAVQLGALQQLSFGGGNRLPEEAALLMAGYYGPQLVQQAAAAAAPSPHPSAGVGRHQSIARASRSFVPVEG